MAGKIIEQARESNVKWFETLHWPVPGSPGQRTLLDFAEVNDWK